jgi:hypothetical protein
MSMNNEKRGLDLGDVAGFDEHDNSSGLGDMYISQAKSAEDYKLNDVEDFASYISRTSTDAVENVIEDNLIAKYLREQGTSEAAIRDQAFIDEEGNKTSIFDLDASAQKHLLKTLKTELGTPATKESDNTLVIDEDDDIAAILEAYQSGDIEGVVNLLKENGYVADERPAAASLSDEEVLFIHAKNTCPDCDDDEIEDFVTKVKSGSQKNKIIEGVRTKLIEIDKQVKEQESFKAQQEMLQEAQQNKKAFIQSMSKIDNVYGFENDSDIVSDVSSYLYDYDEDYDTTPFYRDLATDPEMRYKVAFFAKYGDQVIEQLQERIKSAFNEGKKSVLSALPTKGKSSFGTSAFMSGKGKGKAPDLGDI